MEVYNVTLLYVIINMILFSKDILHPKSDLLFSNELIEILLILAFATILTISLYLSKDSINALKTSHVIIQTNAIIVIIISLFMWKKTQLNAPLNKT
ncbi:hypothetical protein [uncultured Aquimarina sp.]|uniref:hypothetical protein n=1 Tax=uncultured Aquimarina sp. TaxID=575652 RepID=UPI0026198086|nr:hypothetical protein [uncultured Aquimarina sp.]